MVGFIGALAGGAASGWSKGQLEGIKAKREEKLKMLDMEFTRTENALTREANAKQAAAELASREKLTTATLGVQERLGNLQAETSKAISGAEIGSREKLTLIQIAQRRDEIAAQIASGEKIAGMEVESRKSLAEMQIDAAKKLGSKFVLQADGTSVMVDGNGNPVKMPNDPATGKPMNPAVTDSDTPEMKNIKYLMTFGVPFERAQDTVLGAKNSDRKLAQVAIFKSMADGASTMKNLDEDDLQSLWKQSESFTNTMYPEAPAQQAPATPAPAAGDPNAAVPAVPSSSGETTVPHETLLKQAVDGVNNGTLKREDVRAKLLQKGVPEAKIKAAGL